MVTKCPTCGRQTNFRGECKACGLTTIKTTVFLDVLVITGIKICG